MNRSKGRTEGTEVGQTKGPRRDGGGTEVRRDGLMGEGMGGGKDRPMKGWGSREEDKSGWRDGWMERWREKQQYNTVGHVTPRSRWGVSKSCSHSSPTPGPWAGEPQASLPRSPEGSASSPETAESKREAGFHFPQLLRSRVAGAHCLNS